MGRGKDFCFSITPSLDLCRNAPACHKLLWRIQGERYDAPMDEGRNRVLGIRAAILGARKLAQWDGGKRVPATVAAIADAMRWAEEIMKAIDEVHRR
jgi:hypothetical protein